MFKLLRKLFSKKTKVTQEEMTNLVSNCVRKTFTTEQEMGKSMKGIMKNSEFRNGFDKYMKNQPLNKEDMWEMCQRELYDIDESREIGGLDGYDIGKLDGRDEAIRFAMDLIQRMEK
jgi:hypothetical protein